MREFLSRAGIEFEERNVAHRPDWRAELEALAGDVVVPTTATPAGRVVGFDEDALRRVLARPDAGRPVPWRGLEPAPSAPPGGQHDIDLRMAVGHLRARIQREMEYNAAKGDGAYRLGQHDALRFARDALERVLDGSYEAADVLVDQATRDGG